MNNNAEPFSKELTESFVYLDQLPDSESPKQGSLKEINFTKGNGKNYPLNVEKTQLSKQHSYSGPWMVAFFQQMLSWVIPVPRENLETNISTPDIVDDWEWVLSNAEEYVKKKALEDNSRIQKELDTLKKVGTSLKLRGYFQKCLKETLAVLDTESISLLLTPLDASKRSKIISDVVDNYAESWLEFLKFSFCSKNNLANWKNFQESYSEKKPYEKGVVGSIKELAFSASHGPKHIGLNDKVLSDILWAIWKTLSEAVRSAGFELDESENELIANEIVECRSYFIDLWISTVKNSMNGVKKEGILVQKWKKQEEQHRQRTRGKIADAKFEVTKYEPLNNPKKDIEGLKKVLEEQLSFVV